jgi:hypothetical protein
MRTRLNGACCNPSYLGGREKRKNHGSRLTWAQLAYDFLKNKLNQSMDEDEVVGCLLSNEAPSSISSTATNNNKIPKATKTTIT